MSSSDPVDAEATTHAVVLSNDTAATLASLGAAFDDVVVLDDAQVGELATMSDATTVVVVGPMSDPVRVAIVEHVATRPGVHLALATEPEVELAGLRIVGSGRLGELSVTWWAAAGAVVDSRRFNGPGRPATPLRADADAAFVAGAHSRRSDRGPRIEAVAPVVSKPPAAPAPVSLPEVPPPSGLRGRLAAIGRYRILIACALLVVGAGVGALVAEALGDGDGVVVVLLALVMAVVLALVKQVRTTRIVAAELRDVADRTARLERDLAKQARQLGKRAESADVKVQKLRERVRQAEARLAIVSTASVNFERSRARAAARTAEATPVED